MIKGILLMRIPSNQESHFECDEHTDGVLNKA